MIRVLLGLSLFGVRPLASQNVVAQVVGTRYEEYVDGSLANLALRTPVIARTWRRPVIRTALFLGLNSVYETLIDPGRGQPGHTSWADWGMRAIGYAMTEVLIEGWRALHR